MSELYKAFRRTNGFILTLIGLLFSFVMWFWKPSASVPLWVIVLIVIVLAIVVVTLADALFESLKRSSRLPRVCKAIQPVALYGDARAILLVDASDLFSHDAMVSVFSRMNDFEVLIGTGFVATVQENGRIQVCVQNSAESTGDIWERILQNNKEELSQLIVKPSIPRNCSL